MNMRKYAIPVWLQIILLVSVWITKPSVLFAAKPVCSGSVKCYEKAVVTCSSDFTTLPCYCSHGICTADSVGCCAEGPPGCSGACSGGGCTSCSGSSAGSCQGKDPGDSFRDGRHVWMMVAQAEMTVPSASATPRHASLHPHSPPQFFSTAASVVRPKSCRGLRFYITPV